LQNLKVAVFDKLKGNDECLPLNSQFTQKSVLVKTKPFNRQTVTSINQLSIDRRRHSKNFLVSEPDEVSQCSEWLPVCAVNNSYFKILQGSVATLFRWSWKILSYFVANLSKTLHINFYQNRWSIV